MNSSNLPRHGDEIIEQKVSALGTTTLIAKRQFQQFLDELGTLLDNQDINLSDITQIVESLNYGSRITRLSSAVKILSDSSQLVMVNNSLISRLRADNATLRKSAESNKQELESLQSVLSSTKSAISKLTRKVNDLEQVSNVN